MAKVLWIRQEKDVYRGELLPTVHFVILKNLTSEGYTLQVPDIKNYLGSYQCETLDEAIEKAEEFSKDEQVERPLSEERIRSLRGSVSNKKG